MARPYVELQCIVCKTLTGERPWKGERGGPTRSSWAALWLEATGRLDPSIMILDRSVVDADVLQPSMSVESVRIAGTPLTT